MQIDRSIAASGRRAPEDAFTDKVTVAGDSRREQPSRLAGAAVASAPGSRMP